MRIGLPCAVLLPARFFRGGLSYFTPQPMKELQPWADGWVYVARSDTGHWKIGRSVKPAHRVQHFDTKMPVEVSIWRAFQCDDYKYAEKALHKAFADERVKGEWFEFTEHGEEGYLACVEKYRNGHFISLCPPPPQIRECPQTGWIRKPSSPVPFDRTAINQNTDTENALF